MSETAALVIDFATYQLANARELLLLSALGVLTAILCNRNEWRTELRKLWPSSLKVNLLVYVFDAVIVTVPIALLMATIYAAVDSNGWTLFRNIFEAWSAPVVCLAAVFVGDLVGYWRHRLEHSRMLWAAHSLHHSDEEMTWFTLFRFHPLNRLSTVVIDYGILFALGFPGWAVAIAGAVRHYYGMFIHMNRPWMLGVGGWVLVSPVMHRWHHVRVGQGMRSNYATIFSIFDRAFGTYYVPGPCCEKLGVEGAIHDEFRAQMLLPFAALWRKLKFHGRGSGVSAGLSEHSLRK